MGILTPAQVFRKFVTDGASESGAHEPVKSEIVQLLERIEQSSAAGIVVRQTKAALDAVTPGDEDAGGWVLNDSTASNNGYYYRSAGAWVKGRGFPDTFARLTLGGTANAQTGAVGSGVNPADIEVYYAVVTTANTGAMTLSISGETARDVVNAAGNALSAGEWTGVVLFFLNDDGDYQLLIDAGAAAAAAQSATDAAASLAEFLTHFLGNFADDTAAETAAGTPVEGQFYWNTTSKVFRYYDGSAWNAFPYATAAPGSIANLEVASGAGIEASKLAYLSAATDAQGTTIQAWLDRMKWIEDFVTNADGAMTYGTVAASGVPVQGSGSDWSAVIQRALDWLVANGGGTLMARGDKVYRIDEPLTLLNPAGIQSGRFYNVEFCGAILDYQNLTGSEVGLTLGATNTLGLLASGGFRLANVQAFGPEFDGWDQDAGGTAGTTTRFLKQNYAGHVTLDNVGGHYFYFGEEVFYSFPATKTVNFDRNRVGTFLGEAANAQVYHKMDNAACGLGLLIASPTVPVSDGKINNVVALSYRFESCTVGGVIDPGDGGSTPRISNMMFLNGYNNDVIYDVWRVGSHYEAATPATRFPGGEVSGQIFDVKFIGGIQNQTFDADSAYMVFQSNGNARQIAVEADVPFNSNSFVNEPFGGHYLLGDGSAFTEILYGSTGSIVYQRNGSGEVLLGATRTGVGSAFVGEAGVGISPNGELNLTKADLLARFNRTGSDGTLLAFYQDGTLEGSIDVSGTTVSLTGAHLSRWSQWAGRAPRKVLRGTVLASVDDMCVWIGEDGKREQNENLPRSIVSDRDADPAVTGVFQSYDEGDALGDFYVAQTGDFVIRVGKGVRVARGALLVSAGDGTARPLDPDQPMTVSLQSAIIAKVTSAEVVHTYGDGSYLVPCLLMAC